MTQMPWDRFEPVDEPEPPAAYVPPPHLPVSVPPPSPSNGPTPALDISVQAFAKDILDEAMNYTRQTVQAVMRGQDIDHAHPTVTATTQAGRELVVADAKSRSMRTFIQGLGIDLTFALVAVVATLSGADPFSRETWILFGSLLIKTLIQTVVSYIMRLKVTPTMRTEGEKLAIMPLPRPMMKEQPMTDTTPEADIPDDAQEQLRAAVDVALAQPSAAQGFLSNIPDLSDVGGVKDTVLNVLDTVLDAINTALQYKWIIPDKFEKPLQSLADALTKVRGWVD